MFGKEYFVQQFEDITSRKFMRRQQFLRKAESKLHYDQLKNKRRQRALTKHNKSFSF